MSYVQRRRFLWILFLCALALLAVAASATTLSRLKLEDLVRESTAVARMRCLGASSQWDKGEIWTETRFEVLQTEKGALPGIVTVRQLGGHVGHVHSHVDEVPAFRTGEEVYLFPQISPLPRAMCAGAPGVFTESPTGPQWNAWGANIANTRYTDTAVGFAAELPRLKLKWAFGFPGDNGESGQPTTAGGRVFVGSQGGKVYSLSAETGCVHWWFEASASVRTAVVIGRIETESGRDFVAFFGDNSATVYAVSAETGKLLWKMKADSHPAARITGSPSFYHGRLYVPVSSNEEGTAIAPDYPCCSFRGSVVALDGATGK